ncbi:MAG: TIGR04255 family protein [Planctomycetaceae bacterium]
MPGPTFANPPAMERVLSVQFRELPAFELQHYGMWYEQIKNRYPLTTRQPRLPRIIEQFPYKPVPQRFQFGVETAPELPHCVFAAEGQTRLLQLQPDRFAMNWRRKPGDEYRRFNDTKADFFGLLEEFRRFCLGTGLGEVSTDMFEVTDVNQIDCPPGRGTAEFVADVFEGIDLQPPEDAASWLPYPFGTTFNRLYDFGDLLGRLYAEISVVADSDHEYILYKLTARARIEPSTCEQDLEARLQLAHDWVVKGFVATTRKPIRNSEWRQVE